MIATRTATAAIEEIITPYIGAHMAHASTEAHTRKLGLTGEQLTEQQVRALVDQLAMGLRVFVGPDKTAKVVQEIRARLGVKEVKA